MSNLARTSPSTTPEFIGKPDVTFPFLNYPSPDVYARLIRRQMKQASPPFSPIVPARTSMTNLLLQSEALGTTWTQNAVTIGTDGVANPNDGTVNADKVIDSAANSAHSLSQAVTIAAGSTYTFAVAVLASGRTRGRIRFGDSAFASVVADLEYDLTAGTVTGTQTTGTPTITNQLILSLPNSSWFYLIFTVRLDGVTTAAAIAHGLHNGTSYSYAGDGASGAYFYRPTLVLGSYTRIPLIDTTTTTRTILAPEVYPEDPFAYIVWEQERPNKGANEELTWERVYATIPKPQTSYPGSKYFPLPAPPNDYGAVTSLPVTDWASGLAVGNGTFSLRTSCIYVQDSGAIYGPTKKSTFRKIGYATAGTFTLTFGANTTGSLNWNDSAATIAAAINGLASIISAGLTATVINGLSTTTGGYLSIGWGLGTTTSSLVTMTSSLTKTTTGDPTTFLTGVGTSVSGQQILLPDNYTITAHGFNDTKALAVVRDDDTIIVLSASYWDDVDANTIWAPTSAGIAGLHFGTYASDYRTGKIVLLRRKFIEYFYLEDVTTGISSIDDITRGAGLQNPTDFITGLMTLTGWQIYESDGPMPWLSTLIHTVRDENINLDDII